MKSGVADKPCRSGLLLAVASILVLNLAALAERLPISSFSTADGLATSVIHHVYRDSRGFLWFSGRGGLSRYDGYEFTAYRFGTLESPLVHCVLESSDGRFFWIASDEGLFRVDRASPDMVRPATGAISGNQRTLDAKLVERRVYWTLVNDSERRVVAGGPDGFRIVTNPASDEPELVAVDFDLGSGSKKPVYSMTVSPSGEIWFVTDGAIGRFLPGGRVAGYRLPRLSPDVNGGVSVRFDWNGRVWASFKNGVYVMKPETAAESAAGPAVREMPDKEILLATEGTADLPEIAGDFARIRVTSDALSESGVKTAPSAPVEDFFAASDGRFVVPSTEAIYFFENRAYTRVRDDNGQPGRVRRIAEDEAGNLWFGTFGGLMRYSRGGMATFNATSGLRDANVYRIWESADGGLMVSHGDWLLTRLDGRGPVTRRLNVPADARITWTSHPMFETGDGSIWAIALNGVYRFRGGWSSLAGSSAEAYGTTAHGFTDPAAQRFYRGFADRAGDFWLASRDETAARPDLRRFDTASNEFKSLSASPGFPSTGNFATQAEDRGVKWFGFYGAAGVMRFADGRFGPIAGAEKITSAVLAMKLDAKGRLWLATTENGVVRVDDPHADVWNPVMIGEEQGLTSNNVRCLTDDQFGNIYAGTVRGVSRIDGESMRVSGITTVDGLAADFVQSAFRDSRGDLWFGTSNGLSKYKPQPAPVPVAPRLFINALTIGGVRYGVSEFGQERVAGIEVGSNLNNFQIGYLAVGAAGGLRYQYRLDGAANADWSAPTAERTITFANLAPGNYRFEVRAVDSTGAPTVSSAVADFTIKPPVWRTWWFLLLAAIVVTITFYAIYRYRLNNLRRVNAALMEAQIAEEKLLRAREEKLAELEKVRTRIATDLHDDIGSSLTQIAVLSEVARRRTSADSTDDAPLDRITNVSNELVEAMSDIVWAINPRKDSIRELMLRMRRFASDVLSARDIDFEFESEVTVGELPLGANIRREVFSIFKECVTNIVRHSGARNVAIDFRLDEREMNVRVVDDGRGFDADHVLGGEFSPEKGGNGLGNMRRRARELGGECRIESGSDGTRIELVVPVAPKSADQTASDK